MKAKMAEGSEYFSVGSVVSCKNCFNQNFEGEVLAFDPQTKMLILKSTPTNGKPNINDIHMINIQFVGDVEVKKEAASGPLPPLQNLNLGRLSTRARHQCDGKLRLLNAMAAGVTPEGQQLFLAITKTIDEVTWSGQNIVVMNQVTISPPYRPENCKGKSDSQALIHVRKIVEKHLKDQQVTPTDQVTQSANSGSQPQSPQA